MWYDLREQSELVQSSYSHASSKYATKKSQL